MSEQRDYGVEEFVPMEARHYGFWDMAAVWLGANAHPSTWWIGGVIAAAGFGVAIKVNLLANPIAAIFIALIGFIGFKVGTTTIGVARVSMGIKGSNIAGILNVVNLIGWCAISNFLAAITISYILAAVFGTPAYGEPGSFWIMIFGSTLNGILSMMLVGINGSRSIAIAEKFLTAALLLMSAWISIVVFRTYNFADIMAWVPEAGIKMPFGTAFDYIFVMMVGWVVTCCEFTRYSKTKSGATLAPAVGLTFAAWWFIIVGTLGTIAVAMTTGVFDPNMADPSSLASGLGLGWVAFAVIIMSTVTTNLISIYVGAYSLMAVKPKLKIKPTLWKMGIVCIFMGYLPIIIGSFYAVFSTFLGYIGAVLPTLGAILIVDYYIIRKGNYDLSQISSKTGPYWYKDGYNWYAIIVWIVSAASTYYLKSIGVGANFMGMVLPGILIAGVLYYIVAKIAIKNNVYTDISPDQTVKQNA
jgi:NCS1 nucleoside transporter family